MSNKTRKLPELGKSVYLISESNFDQMGIVVTGRGIAGLNALSYFAVEAVKVMGVRYVDDKMEEIIINEGTKNDAGLPAEIRYNLEKPSKVVFMEEAEAAKEADLANAAQEKFCKEILDTVTKAFNQYGTLRSIYKTNFKQ
jgi:hypothetical protein